MDGLNGNCDNQSNNKNAGQKKIESNRVVCQNGKAACFAVASFPVQKQDDPIGQLTPRHYLFPAPVL